MNYSFIRGQTCPNKNILSIPLLRFILPFDLPQAEQSTPDIVHIIE